MSSSLFLIPEKTETMSGPSRDLREKVNFIVKYETGTNASQGFELDVWGRVTYLKSTTFLYICCWRGFEPTLFTMGILS